MSTHEVLIIKIKEIQNHPNADLLQQIPVFGYNCIVKKDQFKIGDLAVYVEPDYLVDTTRSEFSFLSDGKSERQRIRARKLRGIWSQGLLIPLPECLKHLGEGTNVIKELDITRYEPVISTRRSNGASFLGKSQEASPPDVPYIICKYDLENYRKFNKVFSSQDSVIYTAKLHGSNARYVFHDGKMHVGSRTRWLKRPEKSYNIKVLYKDGDEEKTKVFFRSFNFSDPISSLIEFRQEQIDKHGSRLIQIVDTIEEENYSAWWSALEQNPWIEEWCRKNVNKIMYGEIVGEKIQGSNFHYGHKGDSIGFYAFDIMNTLGSFIDNSYLHSIQEIKTVPVLYEGQHNEELLKEIAEQTETFNNANHIREGVVIKCSIETVSVNQRKTLKYVSNTYWSKS